MDQKQKTDKKEEEERLKIGNNNAQLRIANATSGGARKAAWANVVKDRGNVRVWMSILWCWIVQ